MLSIQREGVMTETGPANDSRNQPGGEDCQRERTLTGTYRSLEDFTFENRLLRIVTKNYLEEQQRRHPEAKKPTDDSSA